MSTTTINQKPKIHAVDLFCGAGGLTCGLKQAGIGVMAGVDVETRCEFAYSHNNQETGVSYGALADALAGRAPLSMSDLLYAGLGLPERLEELLFLGGMPAQDLRGHAPLRAVLEKADRPFDADRLVEGE